MKKLFILIAFLSLSANMLAQTGFDLTVADKKRVVTGSQSYEKNDEEIFANALLWAIERGDKLKDLLDEIDYERLRFTMVYNIIQEESMSYSSLLTVQVAQGRLVYLISNIKGQTSGLGGMLGATNFDKLNPEKKPKHKAIMEEFEVVNKKQLKAMLQYVGENKIDVSNWKDIAAGQLKKGMSESDVLLIHGKPIDRQTSNGTTQLMYSQYIYVFLEEGKVKSFTQ